MIRGRGRFCALDLHTFDSVFSPCHDDSRRTLATGTPQDDLDGAHDEFLWGENPVQKRQEGSYGGGSETGDVLEVQRGPPQVRPRLPPSAILDSPKATFRARLDKFALPLWIQARALPVSLHAAVLDC